MIGEAAAFLMCQPPCLGKHRCVRSPGNPPIGVWHNRALRTASLLCGCCQVSLLLSDKILQGKLLFFMQFSASRLQTGSRSACSKERVVGYVRYQLLTSLNPPGRDHIRRTHLSKSHCPFHHKAFPHFSCLS